jgi:hypothetical protein
MCDTPHDKTSLHNHITGNCQPGNKKQDMIQFREGQPLGERRKKVFLIFSELILYFGF